VTGLDPTIRKVVRFSGRVQGVGFRWTTCRIAESFDVVGYVQNRADGSVRLVAEGSGRETDAFIAAVTERMREYITDVESSDETPSGEFSSFDVRH